MGKTKRKRNNWGGTLWGGNRLCRSLLVAGAWADRPTLAAFFSVSLEKVIPINNSTEKCLQPQIEYKREFILNED